MTHQESRLWREADLSLEVVILLLIGEFLLLFGLLLFRIGTGELPYNPDSTYGLFLIFISLQIISLGKTPLGDLRRSWVVILGGICTAVLGMAACFIPGLLSDPVRIITGLLLVCGGLTLLFRLYIRHGKGDGILVLPGLVRLVIAACIAIYVFSVLAGLITLFPGMVKTVQTAIFLILYGIPYFILALSIRAVERRYPQAETRPESRREAPPHPRRGLFRLLDESPLGFGPAIALFTGVLLAFLGLLLIPISQGTLPFSPDALYGLLIVITSLQIIFGDTPVGTCTRSWVLVLTGYLCSAVGIFSCIVPGVLTGILQPVLGLVNIIGGVILLARRYSPLLLPPESRSPPAPPVVRELNRILTLINLVAIIFGVSMLIPGIITGTFQGLVIFLYGILLFILARQLDRLERMRSSLPDPAGPA